MLNFHDPAVVFPLLLCLVLFQDRLQTRILLANVIWVGDPHIKKRVLSSSPKSSGSYVEARIVIGVGGCGVGVLVLNGLEMRFTLDVGTDALEELTLKVPDVVVSRIHETTPHAIHSMGLVKL